MVSIEQITDATVQDVFVRARAKPINKRKEVVYQKTSETLNLEKTNNVIEEIKMKNQPKKKE